MLSSLRLYNYSILEIHNFVDNKTTVLKDTFSYNTYETIKFVDCSFKNVEDIISLFSSSYNLKNLYIEYTSSELNELGLFPKVKKATEIFGACHALKNLNISDMFKCGTLLAINEMLSMIDSIKYIDMLNLKFESIENMRKAGVNIAKAGVLQSVMKVDMKYKAGAYYEKILNYIGAANAVCLEGATVRLPKDQWSRKLIFGLLSNKTLKSMGLTIEKP